MKIQFTKYCVAECVDLPAVTQGKTLDEVVENIKEVIEPGSSNQ